MERTVRFANSLFAQALGCIMALAFAYAPFHCTCFYNIPGSETALHNYRTHTHTHKTSLRRQISTACFAAAMSYQELSLSSSARNYNIAYIVDGSPRSFNSHMVQLRVFAF